MMKRIVFLAVLIAGCKQGKGDRCQVNADCSDNLVCSTATGTCTSQETTGIDATVPPQDGPRDSAPAD
jgi:hypothetical protein